MKQTFNPSNLPAPKYAFSYAAKVSDVDEIVAVGGQLGFDENGKIAPDLVGQIRGAFRCLRIVLNTAGLDVPDIIQWRHYIKVGEDFDVFNRERIAFLDGLEPPASIALIVAQFVRPEMLYEVEAIAVRSRKRS